MASLQPLAAEEIDAALGAWRQGDVALEANLFFLHLADLASPITEGARATATALYPDAQPESSDPGAVFTEIPGVVMLTQTCDIVRASTQRPYVEVAPLIRAPLPFVEQVRVLRRPAFAFIPTIAAQGLVADLDRTMTVEKAIVACWHRMPGWTTDQEGRAIAEALARKRARFAFPDDFVVAGRRFQDRLGKRHDKSHAEGSHLRALREIRVRAAPSWDDNAVHLAFWFIKEHEPEHHAPAWPQWLEEWTALFDQSGRFRIEDAVACRLEDITARDYVESDRLDLDQLSVRDLT